MLIGSCFEPPEFSIIPSIKIEGVRVKEVAGANTPDSLIVTINFKDGDGNIGVDGTETNPPFNERWHFLTSPRATCEPGVKAPCTKISYIDTNNIDDYVTYKFRRTSADYDTLPEYTSPFDCTNYYVLINSAGPSPVTIDTFYMQLNPRYSNLFMDLYVKSGATFNKFNFNQFVSNCEVHGLNGRLPVLAKDKDFDNKLPLEGTITYKILSTSFYAQLANKTLKVKIRIMDRDGNTSNEDESNEFTLK